MGDHGLDYVARQLARRDPTRRGLARLRLAGVLAALAWVAAACRAPKKPCQQPQQCCVGKCKHGKCTKCTNQATFRAGANPACWLSWGSLGGGSRQFNSPFGVGVSGSGLVYVPDMFNLRIQVHDANGVFVRKWGSGGNGEGEFGNPAGLVVGSADQIYVADAGNHRIQQFDATGGFVRKWGSLGNGNGQSNNPTDVAVGSNGHVYVADTFNHRIARLQTF